MDMVVVAFSGGKDSTATLLRAIDEITDCPVVPLFYDTGWEHPITYDYVKYIEELTGLTVERTNSATIPDLIRRYKRFPFGMGRFCTFVTKQTAAYHWFRDRGYYKTGNAQVWLGIRSDESGQRGRKYGGLSPTEVFKYRDLYSNCPKGLNKHVAVRLPIVDWSEADVWRYLESKGVQTNPLYREGTNDRVGCYPCLLAGKKVQERMLATPFGQQRLKVIKQLEEEIGEKYQMYDTDQGSCEVCKI